MFAVCKNKNTVRILFLIHIHFWRISDVDQRIQKRNPVVRSMSDRCDKDSQEVFSFKDTTALRKKAQRTTVPSYLFQKPKNSIYQRPSCPPPSCPLFTQDQDAPQRPPRQQSNVAKHKHKLHKVLFYIMCVMYTN